MREREREKKKESEKGKVQQEKYNDNYTEHMLKKKKTLNNKCKHTNKQRKKEI